MLGYLLLAWRATNRITLRGTERLREHPGAPLAVWHGRMQGCLFAMKGTPLLTMASASPDGEIAARSAYPFGIRCVRGSTGKGGAAALQEAVERVRSDPVLRAVLTVDGPVGPARQVRSGIVRLARALDRPVLPLSFSCRPFWRFTSWDSGIFAPPGARILAEIGAPISVPGTEDLDASTNRVQQALTDLTDRLDRQLHGRPLWGPPPPPDASER